MYNESSSMEEVLEIRKAQEGDKSAFEKLYKNYYARIYRYCRINLYNKMLAEDVCQEAFIRAWKAMPRFSLENGGTFQAFLFKIARNLIIDLSRKRKEVALEEAEEVASDEDLIENEARRNDIENVRLALKKLDEKDRQILILRYFEDLSHAEVAQIMGTKEGALRVRAMRALKKLKSIIEL